MKGSWLAGAAALLLFGCAEGVVFQNDAPIPDGAWNNSLKPAFSFSITDTVSAHDVYIDVRHTTDYAYSNLYLFVDLEGPGGPADPAGRRSKRDTVECLLADPMGRWLGDGTGFIVASRNRDAKVLYKLGNRFPAAGQYTIRLEQAMRDNPLPGILDVGVSIERSKQQ